MEYTTLSLAQVPDGLDAVATDVQSSFGTLDAQAPGFPAGVS
jgi:hypothetical protein